MTAAAPASPAAALPGEEQFARSTGANTVADWMAEDYQRWFDQIRQRRNLPPHAVYEVFRPGQTEMPIGVATLHPAPRAKGESDAL